MNFYFLTAAILVFVIGAVHSILGERLVFKRLWRHGIIPMYGGHVPAESKVGILWASWHIVTVLGWFIAVVLLWLASSLNTHLAQSAISMAILSALLGSSTLVFVGTKGRHPGWAGLLVAALLTFAGMYVN